MNSLHALLACAGYAGVLVVSSHAQAPAASEEKAARLAEDGALLEDLLARQRGAPLREAALDNVRRRLAASEEHAIPERNYHKLKDGWVKGPILRFLRDWNEAGGSGLAPALDLRAEGHPFDVIVDFSRQLEEHGIDLLLVPVPNRVDIYGDQLLLAEPQAGYAGFDTGTTQLLLELSRAGVEIVSLTRAFLANRASDPELGLDNLYLRFNHHWTPRAVEIAAGVIARRIAAMPGFERGGAVAGEDYFVVEEELEWSPERVEDYMFDFEPERLQFRRVLDGEGAPAARWDRDSPVLVLGDSFAVFFRDQSADLLSQLYTQLGFAVDAIAIPGSAGEASRAALRRRGDGLAGKRIVVWTFAVSALQYNEWKKIDVFGE